MEGFTTRASLERSGGDKVQELTGGRAGDGSFAGTQELDQETGGRIWAEQVGTGLYIYLGIQQISQSLNWGSLCNAVLVQVPFAL